MPPMAKKAPKRTSAKKIAAPKRMSQDDAAMHGRRLADVLANPRDDGPRAVLADWFAEREDPRGELITLQLVLGLPAVGARAYFYRGEQRTEEQQAIQARVTKLLKKHQAEWLKPFRAFIRTWQWRRGFADWFESDAQIFLGGLEVMAQHTPIAHVKLTGMKPGTLEKLCARDELLQLESLDLHEQRITAKDAAAIGSARFTELRKLDVWGNPFGDAGLAAIVASPHLAGLEHLHLYKCGLTKASLVALSRAPCLASLKSLDLTELVGCDAEIGTLFARATNLRELTLGSAVLTDEILEAIAANPAFANLEHLSVPHVSWRMSRDNPDARDLHTERGVRALLDSPHLRSLQRLHGVFTYDSDGPLGMNSVLAAAFRARHGDDVI